MSAVTPDSTIRLLKCPIKLDDHNQITFASVTDQTNYFKSLSYLSDNNLSYIRKDGVIRVGTSSSVTYEDVLEYNYVMYQNTHYDTKWFYAYITNVEYKNDGCTEISIETDVYQTWMFEMAFQTSFIEREHVNDDAVGKHTVPENVELGEYICNGSTKYTGLNDLSYIICSTKNHNGQRTTFETTIGNIPFSGCVYVCPNAGTLSSYLQAFGDTNIQNVYSVYAVPTASVAGAVYTSDTGELQYKVDTIAQVSTQITVNKPTTINGWTPVNKKLLTFPYCYLLVSNNNGQSNILHFEDWSTTNCTFDLESLPVVGCDIQLIPTSYENNTYDGRNIIVGGKFPTLSWSQDGYTNWLSQNAVNIGIGQATSGLSIIGGVALLATGAGAMAGAGLIAGGIGGIANSMMQVYQHSFEPTSLKGNVNTGSLNTSNETNTFYFYGISIRYEYAQIIDNFFEVYGYKVNRIGTPHIHARTYWDYCKTIDVHISGNIPEKDMIKLRSVFNSGCTFWHDTSHFMDYSLTNSIIT